jgi:hypothetical protein
MTQPQPPPGATILHYYNVFVQVPLLAPCPHGGGPTQAANQGVRIICPQGDCWFVKWQWEAQN